MTEYPYSQPEIHIVSTALNRKKKKKVKQNKPIALAFCICLIDSSWSATCLFCTNRVCALVERLHPKQSLWNLKYTTLFTEQYNSDKPLPCHHMPGLWANRFSVLALITIFKEWIWSVLCTIILTPKSNKLYEYTNAQFNPYPQEPINCCPDLLWLILSAARPGVGFRDISFHFAYLYHCTCASSLSFSII